MNLVLRFRDIIRNLVTPWLADRRRTGKTVGFRFVWTLVAPLDAAADVVLQGLRAWMPGLGTPTALPLIGRSRFLIRNQDEGEASYAERLINWIDTHVEAGWEVRSAIAIHSFLRSRPRVRVINRSGLWTTVEEDGTVSQRRSTAWDWDSVSHPERSDPEQPWWSDLWMVVYTTQWPARPGVRGDLVGDDGFAIGHMATHEEVDATKSLLTQYKSAHSRWRAVIFCTDPDLFDPDVPASLPDGTWGDWGMYSGSSYVPSGRDRLSCRYWELR